ncbi:hypothetical protein, partial [Chloroflexus sp.]
PVGWGRRGAAVGRRIGGGGTTGHYYCAVGVSTCIRLVPVLNGRNKLLALSTWICRQGEHRQ